MAANCIDRRENVKKKYIQYLARRDITAIIKRNS